MSDLFEPIHEAEDQRLQHAGWSKIDYHGQPLWRAPNGDLTSKEQALKRLDANEQAQAKKAADDYL